MSCNCESKERHDWFPMSPATFFQSDTVQDCAPWEVQCFLHMLMLAWQGPGLPADRKRLARRLGLDESRLDELLAGPVGEKWTECCGKLWNEYLEAERERAQVRRESYQLRGKKGGKASGESRRSEAPAKQELCTSEATASLQPSPSEAPAKLSEPQDRTGQDKTVEDQRDSLRESPPSPPDGGGAALPRGRSKRDALEVALSAEMDLPEAVVAAAHEFRDYRREARIKAYSPGTWQAQLAKAREHPSEVCAAWAEAKLKGWQGPRIDEHIQGRASPIDRQAVTTAARESKNYPEDPDAWKKIPRRGPAASQSRSA